MNWDKIKNFVFGGGAAVLLVVLLWFITLQANTAADKAWTTEAVQLKLNAMIDDKLASIDVPTDTELAEIGGRVDVNGEKIASNKGELDYTRQQLLDMGRVLMRRPDDEP